MVIDGFVASVPASEKASYVDYTNRIDALFLEYGDAGRRWLGP